MMAALPRKYNDVFDWLATALDGIESNQGKINLNVNGGAIDADVITYSTEVDECGRKVRVEKKITTHLRLRT